MSFYPHRPSLESLEPRLLLSGTAYIVDSLLDTIADDGHLTLREALQAANTNTPVHEALAGSSADPDSITFAPSLFTSGPATLTLNGTELTITDDLILTGPGSSLLTLDAAYHSRVLFITGATAQVTGLTFTHGNWTNLAAAVSISNGATVTLANCVITGNQATLTPAGLAVSNSTLLLDHCEISHNVGIGLAATASQLTILDSQFLANSSSALSVETGTLTVLRTAINDNAASTGQGGGGLLIRNATATLIDSSFLHNSAAYGGAINAVNSTLTLTNCTLAGNIANNYGGGLMVTGGNLTLTNTTINANSANLDGGGLFIDVGAIATASNTLIQGNTTNHNGAGAYVRGSLAMFGGSVVNNTATLDGGGLYVRYQNPTNQGHLSLSACSITGNIADNGAGLFIAGQAELNLCDILSNIAADGLLSSKGGGLFITDTGSASLNLSTISQNLAYPYGSGLYSTGHVTLTACSIDRNAYSYRGSGLYLAGTASLINTVVLANWAVYGGGVYVAGNVTITHSTLTANTGSYGAGIHVDPSTGSLVLNNSLVARNAFNDDIDGSYTGQGNFVGGNPHFLRNPWQGSDDTWGTDDDDLGDLRLRPSSPALDIALAELALDAQGNPLTSDRAFEPRVLGPAPDAGAYEGPADLSPGVTYVVNSLLDVVADDGLLTLREAILAASSNLAVNQAPAGGDHDAILFDPSLFSRGQATILLSGQELAITDNLTLLVPDGFHLTLDAAGLSRVMSIHGADVELSNLTLRGGHTDHNGAGLNVTDGASLSLVDSLLTDNLASGGAGLFLDTVSSATLNRTTLRANLATDVGGGLQSYGSLTLRYCLIASNSANGNGGGLHLQGNALVLNCLLVGNSALTLGGAIFTTANTNLLLLNSTLAANWLTGPIAFGAGLYVQQFHDEPALGQTTLTNTIVALNAPDAASQVYGPFVNQTSYLGNDPRFLRNPSPGPDAQWGTPDDDLGDTHLRPSSPCRDAGTTNLINDPNDPLTLPTDLDGNPRVFGLVVDIGAYETPYQGFACDFNLDGRVDVQDINPFVLAMTNLPAYQQQYPDAVLALIDPNADGLINAQDINALTARLAGQTVPFTGGANLFDEAFYLQHNPDVAALVGPGNTYATARDHFTAVGQAEGRQPNAFFNESFYLAQNPDVAAAVADGLFSCGFEHFARYGQTEARDFSKLFDERFYLANNPDVASGVAANLWRSGFEHFVVQGYRESRRIIPLFDEQTYLTNNPDVAADTGPGKIWSSGFDHFLAVGQFESRRFSPYFFETAYLLNNPDIAPDIGPGKLFTTGLHHYLVFGQYEGRIAV